MATINLTNVIRTPTGSGTNVQFDKPGELNLTAGQAKKLLTDIRAQITAGGTVQTGYLSLQRADNGEFTIENRSRFNPSGDKDVAAALVKNLIRIAYGDAIGAQSSAALETAIDAYLSDKSFGKKLGTVSFVRLLNELDVNTGGTATADKKSSFQSLLGAGGSLAVDSQSIAKGAAEIRSVHLEVDRLQVVTQGLMAQDTDTANSIPDALAQFKAHGDLAAQIKRDFPGNQTLLTRAGQLEGDRAKLAEKLNTDISARVDTLRPVGQQSGLRGVAELQGQIDGLNALRRQLTDGPGSPVLPATLGKLGKALAQASIELGFEKSMVDLATTTQNLLPPGTDTADRISAATTQIDAHVALEQVLTNNTEGLVHPGLAQSIAQLDTLQTELRTRLNTDISARVDTIRPPGQEGQVGALGGAGAVTALQDQIQGLQTLRSQLPQGSDSPILPATRSKADAALSQAEGELAARQASNLTQAELREQGPVKAFATRVAKLDASTKALLRVDTYTPADVTAAMDQFKAQTALRQEMTRYNDGLNNTSLNQTIESLGVDQDGLRTKLNAEILKLLEAMKPGTLTVGERVTIAKAAMQTHVDALVALQTQLGPAPQAGQPSAITPETRDAVRQALTSATSELNRLNNALRLQGEDLAARSQSAIDEAQQILNTGGGLTTLKAQEIRAAVDALVKIDRLLGAADSATGPHREALQAKRGELASAITAAVQPHVDPTSLAALQLKVEQIAGLGLEEATELLNVSFTPIVETFVTDVVRALRVSASQTSGRVNDVVDGLQAAFDENGVGGLVNAVSDGVDKAGELAELAMRVQEAVTAKNFAGTFAALDALVEAADPNLRADLRVITAKLMGSLREAVDSVPGKLTPEAQTKLLVGAYEAVAAMERALPADGPANITALRGEVTAARQQAFTNATAGVIEAARNKELAEADAIPDLGRKTAALNGILARAMVLTGEDGPAAASGNAYADRVRGLAVAALTAQRAALETTLTEAGSAAPAGGERSAARTDVTADLRSFIRNLDALESAAPGQDVTTLRATVAQLQFKDVLNQLGPKAREAVDSILSRPAPADRGPHPMGAALLRLYEARALTLPSFTDRLEFLAGRSDTASLIIDLANGDAAVINGFFSGPEWDATALRMKLLAVTSPQQGSTGATAEKVQLAHSLLVAKRSLDFALRVGNPTWRAEERATQLRTNPLGPSAGGMLNITFDQRSVTAFLNAGAALVQGAASDAGQPDQRLKLDNFKLTLARVVHLERMQRPVSPDNTVSLVREILGLPADMSPAEVLAKTEAGESFSSPEALLKLADALGEFSGRIANNPKVIEALTQFNQDAGDARPAAALLVDRISAHTLTQAQRAGGAGFELQADQRLYGRAWTTTLAQVPPARMAALGSSALLVQSLMSGQRVDTSSLNGIAERLAQRPQLEGQGGVAARLVNNFNDRTNIFSHYFAESSSDFLRRGGAAVDMATIKPEAVRALQAYLTQAVTLEGNGGSKALRDHVDQLVAMVSVKPPAVGTATGRSSAPAINLEEFDGLADALLRALPGSPSAQKGHLERLIGDLRKTVTDSQDVTADQQNVGKASGRLTALCQLAGSLPVIDLHLATERASSSSPSLTQRAATALNISEPAKLGKFPPTQGNETNYRRWAVKELESVNRNAPDLMRIATGVMLEQFANSSYTDFGAYQKALVGGDGIDDTVTQGLKNNLAARLQEVGLGNVSGATGANLDTTGDNQIVSLLRLSLFAYPTAKTFMAQAAEDLPETGELAQEATGALKTHLETYTDAGTLMRQQVSSLMPGQTLEIEITASGSLRIKAPVAAPGVNATAGFSASRSNSLTVTREGDNSYIVVCKTGTSGGLSAGISALAGRVSGSVSAGGNVAAGAVLEFAEERMDEAGAPRKAIDRVGELLTQLLSASGAQDPAAALRNSIPDRMHLLDSRGAYVGAEVGADANAKLPGPLAEASLTLEVDAAVGAEISVTNQANSFEHRRTAQTSYSLEAQASAAVGTQDNQIGASVSSSITMKKEKTMVATHGVVTTDSFTLATAVIENSLNGGRSNGDFDRMMVAIGVSAEVRAQYESQLALMQRQGPTSIALRQQLAPEAALRLATLGPQESAGDILNNPKNYVLTRLEFTVTGQVSRPAPAAEPEAEKAEKAEEGELAEAQANESDPNDLVARSQKQVGSAQEDVDAARVVLANPRAALDAAVGARLAQGEEARRRLEEVLQPVRDIDGSEPGTLTNQVGVLAGQAEDLARSLAGNVVAQGSAVLRRAESVGALGLAQDGAALLGTGLDQVSGALEDVAGLGLSASFDRTGTASSTRVFYLNLAQG